MPFSSIYFLVIIGLVWFVLLIKFREHKDFKVSSIILSFFTLLVLFIFMSDTLDYWNKKQGNFQRISGSCEVYYEEAVGRGTDPSFNVFIDDVLYSSADIKAFEANKEGTYECTIQVLPITETLYNIE
ncbi:hypothetical protein KZO01_07120 [Kurthia zopfii]|uniref:Uncharacterized protein n=1 Tax=Kurthia zopfii TaxID=1650 RepID=A0A8B4QAL4_9BACL|nr:hypothetical protein [Kurthia zopfii]PWI22947.1 hypothetical protein DF281_04700 [Kurthia zopfii]TDR40951.1 hypothetical protein DFR61_10768 [Kurthia zopfii]GEK30403.1 hypothetical protein KZO01_07120 [Kurthia zopfii]STX09783.1 Uncharacterised protein [Kurthia zopfii]